MGRLLRILVGVLAFMSAYPLLAQDKLCEQNDLKTWCGELNTGMATVIINGGEKREYASAGFLLHGPFRGFQLTFGNQLYGVPDGGRLDFQNPRSFRALIPYAYATKNLTDKFALTGRGFVTFSLEGERGAPIDPRLWEALLEAALRTDRFLLSLGGGHDGTAGGYALRARVEIPLPGAPSLISMYSYPLNIDKASGPLPWALTVDGRITFGRFEVNKLFK